MQGRRNFRNLTISGFDGGLSPNFFIASMGHLRIQGGLEPPQPPGFGAYARICQMSRREAEVYTAFLLRQASVSSPMTDRLSSRADTPCFHSSQDRRASLASNTALALMTSLDGVEHTSVGSTPVAGMIEGAGFSDRIGPRQHVPPHTLKIFRDDSKVCCTQFFG